MAPPASLDKINYLNILFMVVSAGSALAYPFETFLLAYGVLGPLHYLTEISWLHDKGYYTAGKRDHWFLGAAAVVITALYLGAFPGAPPGTGETIVYLSFAAALVFLLVPPGPGRFGWLGGALLFAVPFWGSHPWIALFGILFPTLIHVFLFTGMFLWLGAVRGGKFSGYLSLGVFAAAGAGIFLLHPAHAHYQPAAYVRDSYGWMKEDGTAEGIFISLNYYLVKAFGIHDLSARAGWSLPEAAKAANEVLYRDPGALALMSFIAYAYSYHYLNWFSKTSIIGWNRIPKGRWVVILGCWAASLGLYAWDYSLGFRWLFFLSFAHVLLEFPLDHLTGLQLGRVLLGRTGRAGDP